MEETLPYPAHRFGPEAILQFPNPQGGEQQPLGAKERVNGRLHNGFVFLHYRARSVWCGEARFRGRDFSFSEL
jgi:hypothetical protein